MPEAITKYAVNSTLGTKNFMPIDKMIENQYRMVYDGDEVVPIVTDRFAFTVDMDSEETQKLNKKIKMTRNGTFRLTAKFGKEWVDSSVRIAYFINGIEIDEFGIYKEDTPLTGNDPYDYEDTITSSVIECNVGDVLEFEIRAKNHETGVSSQVYAENIRIKYGVVQNVFEDITE